ncbi:hypothetical protein HDU97_005489 [Phlyctochytrium planicorne]|nr:hypothetical protein HDU97_005489 [Phlyctochytrium planicorne]
MLSKRILAVSLHSNSSAYSPETDEMVQEMAYDGILSIVDLLAFVESGGWDVDGDASIGKVIEWKRMRNGGEDGSGGSAKPKLSWRPFEGIGGGRVDMVGSPPLPCHAIDGDASLMELLDAFKSGVYWIMLSDRSGLGSGESCGLGKLGYGSSQHSYVYNDHGSSMGRRSSTGVRVGWGSTGNGRTGGIGGVGGIGQRRMVSLIPSTSFASCSSTGSSASCSPATKRKVVFGVPSKVEGPLPIAARLKVFGEGGLRASRCSVNASFQRPSGSDVSSTREEDEEDSFEGFDDDGLEDDPKVSRLVCLLPTGTIAPYNSAVRASFLGSPHHSNFARPHNSTTISNAHCHHPASSHPTSQMYTMHDFLEYVLSSGKRFQEVLETPMWMALKGGGYGPAAGVGDGSALWWMWVDWFRNRMRAEGGGIKEDELTFGGGWKGSITGLATISSPIASPQVLSATPLLPTTRVATVKSSATVEEALMAMLEYEAMEVAVLGCDGRIVSHLSMEDVPRILLQCFETCENGLQTPLQANVVAYRRGKKRARRDSPMDASTPPTLTTPTSTSPSNMTPKTAVEMAMRHLPTPSPTPSLTPTAVPSSPRLEKHESYPIPSPALSCAGSRGEDEEEEDADDEGIVVGGETTVGEVARRMVEGGRNVVWFVKEGGVGYDCVKIEEK